MQEIGPRFTLKLRWLKKNIPAVQNFGEDAKPLTFDTEIDPFEDHTEGQKEKQSENGDETDAESEIPASLPQLPKVVPPKQDEYIWQWKVRSVIPASVIFLLISSQQPELETTRRTFFL